MIVPFGTMLAAFLIAALTYQFLGRRGALYRALVPALLFVSFSFGFQASPGLPILTVYTTMSIVIVAAVWYVDRPVVRLQLTDLLVAAYFGTMFLALVVSSGLKVATAQLLTDLITVVGPYTLFRLGVPKEEVPRLLATVIACLFFLALLSPLEAFLLIKPTAPMQAIWPTWGSAVDFFRGGFNRVASTFGHAIHAGLAFTLGAMFIWFLLLNGRFGRLSKWLFFLVVFGVTIFLTGSRSAYSFSVPMLAMIYFHFSRRQVAYGLAVAGLVLTVLLVVLPVFNAYASASSGELDETQTSVIYRRQVNENYTMLALAKPLTGWGASTPILNGQNSIDNHYLLMAVLYGYPATVFFWAIGGWALGRGAFLYFWGGRRPKDRAVIWLWVSCLTYIAVSASIVWLSAQALQFYVIFAALLTNLSETEPPPRPGSTLRWL